MPDLSTVHLTEEVLATMPTGFIVRYIPTLYQIAKRARIHIYIYINVYVHIYNINIHRRIILTYIHTLREINDLILYIIEYSVVCSEHVKYQ